MAITRAQQFRQMYQFGGGADAGENHLQEEVILVEKILVVEMKQLVEIVHVKYQG